MPPNSSLFNRTSPNSSLFNRTMTNSKNLDRIWIRWPPNYSVFGSVRKSSPLQIRYFYCTRTKRTRTKNKRTRGKIKKIIWKNRTRTQRTWKKRTRTKRTRKERSRTKETRYRESWPYLKFLFYFNKSSVICSINITNRGRTRWLVELLIKYLLNFIDFKK